MDRVARLPASDRHDLFRETAMLRGVSPAIVEKDFWVCWVLKQIFADPDVGPQFVFKGGTSLAKVYELIERFSEDIDLILDWRALGYGPGLDDPYQDFASNTRRDRFNKRMNQRAVEYITDRLLKDFTRLFAHVSRLSVSVDHDDPQTINVAYPAAFSEEYLRSEIRLEIGPLAGWSPSERRTIRPYAAGSFPDVFADPDCPVVTITAERSFWEKATILHQQAHRKTPMPSRYSRHYYDLYKLAGSPVCQSALADLDLLQTVASFKRRFYPSSWASYETARAGSLKLVPSEVHRTVLTKDFRAMRMMIFGEVPPFDLIEESLQKLELRINQPLPGPDNSRSQPLAGR